MTTIYQPEGTVTTPPVQEGDPPTNDPQIPDEVLEFVGEGKKYTTLTEALKALPHAQKHIATLEGELKQLREAQGSALSQEEVVSAVEAYLKQQGTPPGLDAAGVQALVDRQLEARKAAEASAANVQAFKTSMGQKFGDKQAEVFASKATELGLTPEKLSELVRTSPKAALQLFGIEGGKGPSGNPPPGGLNTEALHALNPQGGEGLKTFRGANTKALSAEYRRVEAELKKKYGL